MAHLLFLSHAGADTERALRPVATIEARPEAREHGLSICVDRRPNRSYRLHAGTPWQDPLEASTATCSRSFDLLLTRESARNCVLLNVLVALDRVIAEPRVSFRRLCRQSSDGHTSVAESTRLPAY